MRQEMVVDVMLFAWEHDKSGVRCTLVLVAAEQDFSYMTDKLESRGITKVRVGDQMQPTSNHTPKRTYTFNVKLGASWCNMSPV